jgi:hypothetical protein
VYSRGPPFPVLPGGFNFSTDGALVDAWPYFPGLKVGKMYLYPSFLLSYLVALIINRDIVQQEYDYS